MKLNFDTKPHVLIVEARFYKEISDFLLTATTNKLDDIGATYEVITVAGALEIPATIKMASKSSGTKENNKSFDAYIALGCVIRGETTHYDIVSGESCRALMDLSVDEGIAIANGILTCENKDQALDRAMEDRKNKGGSFAQAALEMLAIKRNFVY